MYLHNIEQIDLVQYKIQNCEFFLWTNNLNWDTRVNMTNFVREISNYFDIHVSGKKNLRISWFLIFCFMKYETL